MKILIAPEVSKKIVDDEFFKYKVSIGNINDKLLDYIPGESINYVLIAIHEGEMREIPFKDLAIHIIEDVKDEV